jgi:predicted metal-dependent hydrolase
MPSSTHVPTTTHVLLYGETQIPYTLTYAPRKTVAIHVYPDGSVVVKAPLGSSFAAVEAFLHRRAGWIVRKRAEFVRLRATQDARAPRRYVSGESFAHLGRQYRLKVMEGERPWVKLSRGFLEITTPDKANTAVVQLQVEGWQRRQAQRIFYERMLALLPRFSPLVLPEPEITIKTLKSRWGSCTYDGRVTLNLLLIQAPLECIDYVVAHELCHLVEHNHGKGFYALLARVMPDWKARKERLNESAVA